MHTTLASRVRLNALLGEQLKVLAENLAELRLLAQDALEDAVLMGCDETQFKAAMLQLIGGPSSGYTPAAAAGVAGRSS